MTELEIFGNAVRMYRLELGLSQEELAEISNLHRTYIGGIERGERNISLANIIKISKSLNITPSKLLDCFSHDKEDI